LKKWGTTIRVRDPIKSKGEQQRKKWCQSCEPGVHEKHRRGQNKREFPLYHYQKSRKSERGDIEGRVELRGKIAQENLARWPAAEKQKIRHSGGGKKIRWGNAGGVTNGVEKRKGIKRKWLGTELSWETNK